MIPAERTRPPVSNWGQTPTRGTVTIETFVCSPRRRFRKRLRLEVSGRLRRPLKFNQTLFQPVLRNERQGSLWVAAVGEPCARDGEKYREESRRGTHECLAPTLRRGFRLLPEAWVSVWKRSCTRPRRDISSARPSPRRMHPGLVGHRLPGWSGGGARQKA